MISRYEATLNGVALSEIDDSILVLDINYAGPQIKTNTYTSARRQGARVYRRYFGKSTVTISFEIHKYNTQARMNVCNAIQQWAKDGGVLVTSDRDGQRLRCVCDTYPVITSAMKWTEALSVTFSAYAIPFWEESTPVTLTLNGTEESDTMTVPGCVEEALVEVEVTPSGTLTDLDLTVNGRTLSLSGISVSGDTISIDYDENMIQSIRAGWTSLLDARTGVDDLLAVCGEQNEFSFTANVPCSVIFSVRGLWL